MKKSTPAANPDAYVTSLAGWQLACVKELRAAVRASSALDEVVKWGHLVYSSNGPVLLIRAEDHRVLFGFWRGQLLRDIEQRLKPGGKYDMATIELRETMSVDSATVRRLTRKAVALNKTLGDPTKVAKKMNTALLVIDVQQVLSSGKYAVFESRQVIDRINRVIQHARDAGAPVVVIQHEEQDGPMQYGSDGWQLDSGLAVLPSDVHVRKTTPDSFHLTELQALLQARKVEKLVICGFQSEFCVDSTTRRALALGYPVTLVADGHSTLDNNVLKAPQISAHLNETLRMMDSFGPRVETKPAAEVRIGT